MARGPAAPPSPWSRLMLLAQQGDRQAYKRLLQEVLPILIAYMARRLIDKSQAEDLSQDVLLKIHAYRDSYDPRQKFEGWLFSIAANTLVDFLRSQGRRAKFVTTVADIDVTAAGE